MAEGVYTKSSGGIVVPLSPVTVICESEVAIDATITSLPPSLPMQKRKESFTMVAFRSPKASLLICGLA